MKWPYQSTPYLSALPGVSSPALDVSAGDLPSKIYFVTSTENVKKGGPDPRGPNCFSGTFWYCWYADQGEGFHKWIIPLVGGYCFLGRSMNAPERDNFDYIGHAAPGPGLFVQCAALRVRGSNTRIWHLPSWVGDSPSPDGHDKFKADQRDGLQMSASDRKIGKVAAINCEVRFSMDEGVEAWYAMRDTSLIRCAIYDPLHSPPGFSHDGDKGEDHGYAHLIGGTVENSLVQQSLYAHTTGRNPLVASPNHAHINNLHYNHGRPDCGRGEAVDIDDNGGNNAAAHRPMLCNMVGNVSVRGPNQNDEIVLAKVRGVTPGSSAHVEHNSQFGWTAPPSQDGFVKGEPDGYLKPTLRAGCWPLGLGFNYDGVLLPCADPLAPTAEEGLAFSQLMRETVGCKPNRRFLYSGGLNHVLDQIDAAIRGIESPSQYVNSVAEAGGWPAMPSVTVDPADPSSAHHAPMPLGADRDEVLLSGTFSDGSSQVGYSRLRAWTIEQYFYTLGR